MEARWIQIGKENDTFSYDTLIGEQGQPLLKGMLIKYGVETGDIIDHKTQTLSPLLQMPLKLSPIRKIVGDVAKKLCKDSVFIYKSITFLPFTANYDYFGGDPHPGITKNVYVFTGDSEKTEEELKNNCGDTQTSLFNKPGIEIQDNYWNVPSPTTSPAFKMMSEFGFLGHFTIPNIASKRNLNPMTLTLGTNPSILPLEQSKQVFGEKLTNNGLALFAIGKNLPSHLSELTKVLHTSGSTATFPSVEGGSSPSPFRAFQSLEGGGGGGDGGNISKTNYKFANEETLYRQYFLEILHYNLIKEKNENSKYCIKYYFAYVFHINQLFKMMNLEKTSTTATENSVKQSNISHFLISLAAKSNNDFFSIPNLPTDFFKEPRLKIPFFNIIRIIQYIQNKLLDYQLNIYSNLLAKINVPNFSLWSRYLTSKLNSISFSMSQGGVFDKSNSPRIVPIQEAVLDIINKSNRLFLNLVLVYGNLIDYIPSKDIESYNLYKSKKSGMPTGHVTSPRFKLLFEYLRNFSMPGEFPNTSGIVPGAQGGRRKRKITRKKKLKKKHTLRKK